MARSGGAHLDGAHLDGAHLDGARLGGARLGGARLGGARLGAGGRPRRDPGSGRVRNAAVGHRAADRAGAR
ncbi:pentapeptide repeat-containing protein [Streptosporangium fragile]|uniref:pentapeptide repeat-containing protein n=1 Tax=Streptosporangium fragile TaxID=46186 RepID=UPI003CD0B9F4